MKFLEKFDLTGKAALITGGAGLLGFEHAAALLESGASVVLADIDEESLSTAAEKLLSSAESTRITTHVMDVSQPSSIKEIASKLEAKKLRIDILVNNAAIDPKMKGDKGMLESSRLENFPLEQWDQQVAVGLTGAFLCSQVFGSVMARDGKGGVILNIASDLSVISPDHRLYRQDNIAENMQPVKPVTYSTIKAGLIGLTRYLATYWARCGVRVNALCPGGVEAGQSEEFKERVHSRIPMNRMARKDEYHGTVLFMISDESSYMNGAVLAVDGGRTCW